PRRPARGYDCLDHQPWRLCDRDHSRGHRGCSQGADRGRPLFGTIRGTGFPPCGLDARASNRLPGAHRPLSAGHACYEHCGPALRARVVPCRFHHSIAHLPRLRDLRHRRHDISGSGSCGQVRFRCYRAPRLCTPMIREFNLIDVYYLLLAARWTLALTGLAFLGGGLVGMIIAVMRVSPFAPLRSASTFFVNVVQGIPLLAWLFVFFFGLPILAGVRVSPWTAAIVAYAIYAGAFLGEIWRGCLQAIPRQQWEAGAALALSFG